jgi:hypothetical protein
MKKGGVETQEKICGKVCSFCPFLFIVPLKIYASEGKNYSTNGSQFVSHKRDDLLVSRLFFRYVYIVYVAVVGVDWVLLVHTMPFLRRGIMMLPCVRQHLRLVAGVFPKNEASFAVSMKPENRLRIF